MSAAASLAAIGAAGGDCPESGLPASERIGRLFRVYLIGVGAAKHNDSRLEQDQQVKSWRPTPQVLDIVFDTLAHLFDRVGLPAKAVDLRPTGNARLDLVPDHVALDEPAILLVVCDSVRPRSHQTHGSAEYVKELRQFVKRSTAQKRTQGCDALVVSRCLRNYRSVFDDRHRAKFP